MHTTENMKNLLPTEAYFYKDTQKASLSSYIDFMLPHEKHGWCIVLSRTIFYPQGGGQKGDRGAIYIDTGLAGDLNLPSMFKVKDTRKDGIHILHVLDDFDPTLVDTIKDNLYGELVSTQIDFNFRLKQMRLHSIAHLLHFFTQEVCNLVDLPYPVSSDLLQNSGINRYESDFRVSRDEIALIKDRLKKFADSHQDIKTFPDEIKDGYRYWLCDKYLVPCGGAHLTNTKNIGDFALSVSNKKGQTSIKFELS